MRYRTRIWYYEEDGSRHAARANNPADRPVDVEFHDMVVKLLPDPEQGAIFITVQPNKMRTGKWLGLMGMDSRLQEVNLRVHLVDEEGRPSPNLLAHREKGGEGSSPGPGHSRRK